MVNCNAEQQMGKGVKVGGWEGISTVKLSSRSSTSNLGPGKGEREEERKRSDKEEVRKKKRERERDKDKHAHTHTSRYLKEDFPGFFVFFITI